MVHFRVLLILIISQTNSYDTNRITQTKPTTPSYIPPHNDHIALHTSMVSYKYTDYSNVRPDPKALPVLYADGLPSSVNAGGGNQNASSAGIEDVNRNYILRDIRKQVLPVKLNLMLSDPKFSHIISWMPHGRAWRVFRPKEFTEFVAPIYFEYPNYNSFIRLVNAWGFRRVTTGVDTNAYYHEVSLFIQLEMTFLHMRLHM